VLQRLENIIFLYLEQNIEVMELTEVKKSKGKAHPRTVPEGPEVE
jgi:hypothetical protein